MDNSGKGFSLDAEEGDSAIAANALIFVKLGVGDVLGYCAFPQHWSRGSCRWPRRELSLPALMISDKIPSCPEVFSAGYRDNSLSEFFDGEWYIKLLCGG